MGGSCRNLHDRSKLTIIALLIHIYFHKVKFDYRVLLFRRDFLFFFDNPMDVQDYFHVRLRISMQVISSAQKKHLFERFKRPKVVFRVD